MFKARKVEEMSVDLKTFVSEAINGVIEGIAAGQRVLSPDRTIRVGHPFAQDFKFSPPSEISFDIAVTVIRNSSGSGGAKIEVMGIGLGGKWAASRGNSTTTRLVFSVPIVPNVEEGDD